MFFTKILANRLLPHIPGLIHLDQVGFVPGRQARDNIKVLNLIHNARFQSSSSLLLGTDAEKAFDRVDWSFLHSSTLHWSGPHHDGLDPHHILETGGASQGERDPFGTVHYCEWYASGVPPLPYLVYIVPGSVHI